MPGVYSLAFPKAPEGQRNDREESWGKDRGSQASCLSLGISHDSLGFPVYTHKHRSHAPYLLLVYNLLVVSSICLECEHSRQGELHMEGPER